VSFHAVISKSVTYELDEREWCLVADIIVFTVNDISAIENCAILRSKHPNKHNHT
jgi:hypothetical protein